MSILLSTIRTQGVTSLNIEVKKDKGQSRGVEGAGVGPPTAKKWTFILTSLAQIMPIYDKIPPQKAWGISVKFWVFHKIEDVQNCVNVCSLCINP